MPNAQRNQFAQQYLGMWNNQVLAFFDFGAKMSQFAQLWRQYSQCEFNNLVAQYPDSNLPFVLTPAVQSQFAANLQNTNEYYESQMDQYFTFLGVVYWNPTPQLAPGLYRNPVASDAVAYAEVRVFVPTWRIIWRSSGRDGNDFPDTDGRGARLQLAGWSQLLAPRGCVLGGGPPGSIWNGSSAADGPLAPALDVSTRAGHASHGRHDPANAAAPGNARPIAADAAEPCRVDRAGFVADQPPLAGSDAHDRRHQEGRVGQAERSPTKGRS